jgi:hypothetical protein
MDKKFQRAKKLYAKKERSTITFMTTKLEFTADAVVSSILKLEM